jgi:hypothetical protein
MKDRQVAAELFYADRRTDGETEEHDEANNSFKRFYAPKNQIFRRFRHSQKKKLVIEMKAISIFGKIMSHGKVIPSC